MLALSFIPQWVYKLSHYLDSLLPSDERREMELVIHNNSMDKAARFIKRQISDSQTIHQLDSCEQLIGIFKQRHKGAYAKTWANTLEASLRTRENEMKSYFLTAKNC